MARWCVDVHGQQTRDGGYKAAIKVPLRTGVFALGVEVPRETLELARAGVRHTMSLLRAYHRSLHDEMARERAAHTDRVSGMRMMRSSSNGSRPSVMDGLPYALEPHRRVVCICLPGCGAPLMDSAPALVGFDLSSLAGGFRAQLQGAGAALQNPATAQATGQAALQGLLTGGAQGAAQGALQSFGEQTGLASLARTIGTPIQEAVEAPPDGPITTPLEAQRRRNRALREILGVVDLPSHAGNTGVGPFQDSNFRSAITYHRRNGGLSSTEARFIAPAGAPLPGGLPEVASAAARRAVLERLDPRAPLIADDGVTLLSKTDAVTRDLLGAPRSAALTAAGLPYPWPAQYAATSPLVSILMAAQQQGLAPAPLLATSPVTAAAGPLPATTAAVASGAATPRDVAGVEVLSQTLNALLSSDALRAQLEPEVARTIAFALRALETEAGASLGSPRAQAVLRKARLHVADEVARGLSLARLLTRV